MSSPIRTTGQRFSETVTEGYSGGFSMTMIGTIALVAGAIYWFNLSTEKDHYISKRGKLAQAVGHTNLNDQIGMKNNKANRWIKLYAGGKKFDYTKNHARDAKSILYRR